jgi:hypothetical protein
VGIFLILLIARCKNYYFRINHLKIDGLGVNSSINTYQNF